MKRYVLLFLFSLCTPAFSQGSAPPMVVVDDEMDAGQQSLPAEKEAWALMNDEGEEAFMYVPSGQSAMSWFDDDSIKSMEQLGQGDMYVAGWWPDAQSQQEKIDELYDRLVETAQARMCDGTARPESLTVSVIGGASAFVHASAELQATFTYDSLCSN